MFNTTEKLHRAFDRQRRSSGQMDGMTFPSHRPTSNTTHAGDSDDDEAHAHSSSDNGRNDDDRASINRWVFITLGGAIVLVTMVAMALVVRKFNHVKRSNTNLINKLTHIQTQAMAPSGIDVATNDQAHANQAATAHHQVIAKFFEHVRADGDIVATGANGDVELNASLGPNLLLPTLPSIPASFVIDFVMVKATVIGSDLAYVSRTINQASTQLKPPQPPSTSATKKTNTKTHVSDSNKRLPSTTTLSLLQVSDMQTRLNSCEHLVDLIEQLLPNALVLKYCNLQTSDVRNAIANQRAHLRKICAHSLHG